MAHRRSVRAWSTLLGLGALALSGLTSGCGSGGGGGGGGDGNRLVLVHFLQSGEDNVPLNRVLEFDFSAPVAVDSVDPSSLQIRSGPTFGETVEGRFIVQSNRIFFEPRLPGTCSLLDAGFRADTDYRVTLIGSPEEFALRATNGDPLESTIQFSFHTRADTDPSGLFEDQVPGVFPTVIATSPTDGAYPPLNAEVLVGPSNRVIVDFSENIDPCSISPTTVRINQVATGNPDDFPNGFDPDSDQTPGDPFTWGSGTATLPPQRIRSTFVLTQTFLSTRLEIIPDFGEFPDNALIAVEMTSDVRDYGGNPLIPRTISFVTENRAAQCKTKVLAFNGDVAIDENLSTGDVNTPRAPGRAQGFLLFAGDGDNGTVITKPSGPNCGTYFQANDGSADDFDTPSVDIVLDTGASPNLLCNNETDGSRAVVFEFRTFRIRSGRTVTIVGKNPAIILVSGDVMIESGGRLLCRGGAGENGQGMNTSTTAGSPAALGGVGIAGGAAGGTSNAAGNYTTSQNGSAGFSSPDYLLPPGKGASTDPVLVGPGRGTVSSSTVSTSTYSQPANIFSPGGGGGGHAIAGATGQSNGSGTTPRFLNGVHDGAGGGTYGNNNGKLPTPESGSGGGAGGIAEGLYPGYPYPYYDQIGGGGGAGGGFLDITAEGKITVLGTIDVSGGKGGNGGGLGTGWTAAGGGGGGSGGGLRLLTPDDIQVATTTLITAAGGGGGNGGNAPTSPNSALVNNGGQGGVGRLVFEDGDSVITGYVGAAIIPGESSSGGFYRGLFDASRFQGGGITPTIVTQVSDMGPTFPTFVDPVQTYGGQEDFVAGIPAISSRGLGATSILVEAQGFPANADGTPDMVHPTGWIQVGYFTDSGAESFPTWVVGTPGDVILPVGSLPGGFGAIDNHEFVQFRITFYLKSGMGPFDPGPYIDDWTLHFCYDQ